MKFQISPNAYDIYIHTLQQLFTVVVATECCRLQRHIAVSSRMIQQAEVLGWGVS